jgi:hypothetical protein
MLSFERKSLMDIFNVIAGSASILSLLISLFVANKVISINNQVKNILNLDVSQGNTTSEVNVKQKVKGSGNIQSGRDTHVG